MLSVPASVPTAPAFHRRCAFMTELMELYRESNFFALRERLAGATCETPETRFLRAAVSQAFNQPERALAAADEALARGDLPDDLRLETEELRLASWMRLFRYAQAERAAERILDGCPSAPADRRDDVANVQRLLAALRDVPPQRVVRRGPTRLRVGDGLVPVTVGTAPRAYIMDTGANLCTVMRSEALSLGLRIRPAGFAVGTSTDLAVAADVAVAERLAIGGLEFRDVVFLVLDDAALTFADGASIPGLIGFPVMEQMTEIRMVDHATLEVPEQAPRRTGANLALQGMELLTPVEWEGETVVCRLDTGAERTVFYEPFFRRYRTRIESAGRPDSLTRAGAGGERALDAWRLEAVHLAVGGTRVTLESTHVLTRPITRTAEANRLAGNLGRDVLNARGEYVLNFRDMAFVLGPRQATTTDDG